MEIQQKPNNHKMHDLFEETQELVDITRSNIKVIVERGIKLNHLEKMSNELLKSSIKFKIKSSEIVPPWYKRYKYYLGGIGLTTTTIALLKIIPIILL